MALGTSIAFLTAAAALVLGSDATATETMTPQEFLAQYEPAVEKLKRFYTHMTLEATITRSAMEAEKPVIERQRIVVQTDGDRMRVEGIVPDGAQGETVRVGVATPSSSFGAHRDAGQKQFALSYLSSDFVASSRTLRSSHYYMFAPFCENGGLLLSNKFRAKNIRISAAEQEKRGGEILVKVAYERDVSYGTKSITYSGYDVFSKTRGWALVETVAGGGEQYQKGVIEYDGMIDGVPLLKSAEYWRQKGDRRVNILRCDVTKLEPAVVPAEAFEITSLVPDMRPAKKSSSWLWLIGGCVVLIAIAMVVVRLAAQRRAAA